MRTLKLPRDFLAFQAVCFLDRTTAICAWLALHSTGSVVDVGCHKGRRALALARILLRFKRSVIAVDWSQEHRTSTRQRHNLCPFEVGHRCREMSNVTVLDIDPALVPFDNFQPLGLVVIDYDYSLPALRRITPQVLEAAPVLSNPNVIVAWGGYREAKPDEPNEVRNYVGSLDVSDTYHFEGVELAFKVFNATPEFRTELRELSRV